MPSPTTEASAELGEAILAILEQPEHDRLAYAELLRERAEKARPTSADRFREYAEDGVEGLLRFAEEACGAIMHPQMERMLRHLEENHKAAIVAATGIGKSYAMAIWCLFRFLCRSQLPSRKNPDMPRGCIMMMIAPTEDTLKGTLWDRINGLVVVMEKNGFELPPGKNFKSVAWHVGAGHMMACVPVPQDKKLAIAPKMRGRHGEELIAVVDEAMGLVDRPDVLNALEDGFDGDEDRICFLMNPDAGEATGPWYERCRSGAFAVLHESSFQHVNVMERRIVVPGAVSPHKFDQRVRFDCVDRGPLGEVEPDPDYHDFSYALPPKDAEADYGARPDGVPGWNHPAAVVHVFRPNRRFTAAKIGEFVFGEPGLCPYSRASLLESHNRYLAEDDPKDPPDRVGVDPNRGGKDSAICVPAWGPAAPSLLQQVLRWRQKAAMSIVRSEDDYPDYVRAGAPVRIPDNKIKGPEVAEWLDQRWPDDRTSFVVDSHGVGASVADHLERLGRKVAFVEGPTAPEALLDDEEPYENKRCQGYLRTAALLRDGLLDLHPSEIDAVLTRPSTAQQLLAIRRDITSRRTVRKVYVDGQKVEKVVAKLMPKKQMKAELLGHNSPDEADALVLAVAWETWTGTSLSMCGRY